jgi:hypothetical protein
MKTIVKPALSLEEVARHFEQWRSTKDKGERIPERLWSEAVGLLSVYSLCQVTRALRLDWVKLKRHWRTGDSGKGSERTGGAMAFVEIDTSGVDQTRMPSPGGVEIELERADGLRLRLPRAERADMLALVERFMGV